MTVREPTSADEDLFTDEEVEDPTVVVDPRVRRAARAPGAATLDPARLALAYRRMLAVLTDGPDLPRIAETAARLASELLHADGAAVTRLREGYLEYIAGCGVATALVGRALSLDESFTGRAARRGEPLVFDPRTAPNASADRARQEQICSGVVCPVLLGGQVVGTLGVVSRRVAAFDTESVERLRELAEFVALGLERVRGRRRVEDAWHRARQAELAAHVVQRIEAPLADLMGELVAIRERVGTELTAADPEVGRRIEGCFGAVEGVASTLDELRAFAAVDDDVDPVGTDLIELLRRLAEFFAPRVDALAAFDLELPDDSAIILAAPARLWQLGHALLCNALEAIEERPRGLHRVRLCCRLQPFTAELVVEDSGPGIPASELPLVFEPFHTTRPGHSGLGLTLVWRTVSALGGHVDIESDPGRSPTRVRVRLPRFAEPGADELFGD